MRSGLEVQRAVLYSLILWEVRSRIGKYRLGYLWALLEPLAHVTVLWWMRALVLGRTRSDIPFTVFIIVGVVLWLLFRNVSVRSVRKMNRSRDGLFGHRFGHKGAYAVDKILAYAFFEFVINAIVFAILLYLTWIFMGESVQLRNFPFLVTVYLLLVCLALGLAFLFASLIERFPDTERIIPIAIRPLYFISGIFFSIGEIPQDYKLYFQWNPVLHAVELTRHAIVPTYNVDEASMAYVFLFAVTISFIGLALLRTSANRGRRP